MRWKRSAWKRSEGGEGADLYLRRDVLDNTVFLLAPLPGRRFPRTQLCVSNDADERVVAVGAREDSSRFIVGTAPAGSYVYYARRVE